MLDSWQGAEHGLSGHPPLSVGMISWRCKEQCKLENKFHSNTKKGSGWGNRNSVS